MKISMYDNLAPYVRINLDGEDVTKDCLAADNDFGMAKLVCRNEDGTVIVTESGGIKYSDCLGRVTFTLKPSADKKTRRAFYKLSVADKETRQ